MTGRLRVVVVDDEPAVVALHTRFVEVLDGWAVVGTAATGPDAVAVVARARPDVVLLDMHLPGFSGLEVLRGVRAAQQRQPEVIAVTAARDVETVREARRSGVRHYLVKPFTAAELHARLAELAVELADRAPARAAVGARAGGALDQSEVDAIMAVAAARARLPKGLSAETLALVLDGLVAAEDSTTASDLSAALGLSRVSCRRYLEHLAAEGRAERSLDYATSGRPSVRYRHLPAGGGPVPSARVSPGAGAG